MQDDSAQPHPRAHGQKSFMERIVQALGGEPKNTEELLDIMRDARRRRVVDADSLTMIEGVFDVADMQVRNIMIPRGQMVVVEEDAPLDEILPVIISSGHSRFPVIRESRDEVIGTLLAKDLLRYTGGDASNFRVSGLLRPAVFTPESKRLNVLLKEFRANRNHLAIVVDEYGGVAGLVTIEDVLEEIVGEIDDEHDVEQDVNVRQHGDGRCSVRALTPIDEFNTALGANFGDDEFATIGGLIMQHIGHMPRPNETADIGGFHFRVLSADKRRIHLLQVSRGGAAGGANSGASAAQGDAALPGQQASPQVHGDPQPGAADGAAGRDGEGSSPQGDAPSVRESAAARKARPGRNRDGVRER